MITAEATRNDTICSKNERLTFSSIIAALSYALDLTEGASPGHALRSCLIGMRIGREMGLEPEQLSALYYALLLKDAGCSANASRLNQIVGSDEIRAKAFTKTIDWTRFEWRQIKFLLQYIHRGARLGDRIQAVRRMFIYSAENAEMLIRLRCHRGAAVVTDLGLTDATADAIYSLDEHWNGAGYPDHRAGEQIPLLARILSLAQTLEIFYFDYGPSAAVDCMHRRAGKWFDPAIVHAAEALMARGRLWRDLRSPNLKHHVAALEPGTRHPDDRLASIDQICVAFAGVIDAKSHSTYMHSTEVARIAVELGEFLGLAQEDLTTLRRAALLHDIGKLSVPNSILDKPDKLTEEEWACVRRHPHFSYEILSRIPTFEEIAAIAGAHHEKLDGSGYTHGLAGSQVSQMARILTMADIFEAMTADRPYHERKSHAAVLEILRKHVPQQLDTDCFQALEHLVERWKVRAVYAA